ncbi:MAG: hypothetical protein AB7K36_10660 [Chloroflexota bacterium]
MGDPSAERFVARRAAGWRQQGSTVVLELEGTREPDHTNIAAILAGAPLNDALDRAELAISVLESGAVRLVFSANDAPASAPDPRLLPGDVLTAAPLSVTSTESGLHLASERHGGFGPDPEDVTIEIVLEPFGLTVVDMGGRPVMRLAAEGPDTDVKAGEHRPAPLAWSRLRDEAGATQYACTASVVLEPDEYLFGLGARSGPLNLVGTVQTLVAADSGEANSGCAASGGAGSLPLLLSSRGYGLLAHTRAGLTADLGQSQPGELTLLTVAPVLELVLFPSTWPRTALSNATRLTGRRPAPGVQTFGLMVADGPDAAKVSDALTSAGIPHEPATGTATSQDATATARDAAAPATVDEMRARLQHGLTAGLASPEHWAGRIGVPSAAASTSLRARWTQTVLLGPLVRLDTAPADDRVVTILRAYSSLRYRLLPYLLHCAIESADSGLPMLRPLLLEHSWDPEAVGLDDQFLLGRDMLIAPVFSDADGPVTRRVYLPGYANWYDWWTGTFYDGRQWIETTAPLDRLPIYVRAGTAIPLTDLRQSIGAGPVEITRLLLFAPKESAIGASIELGLDEMMGVEQERGDRKARVYLEGIPRTVRDLEIVGLPSGVRLNDASHSAVQLVPSDGLLPGQGGTWNSLTALLAPGEFTAGLELAW